MGWLTLSPLGAHTQIGGLAWPPRPFRTVSRLCAFADRRDGMRPFPAFLSSR